MEETQQAAIEGANILLKKCLSLEEDDVFLLIFDETTEQFPSIFQTASRNCHVRYQDQFVSKKLQSEGDETAFSRVLREPLGRARGVLLATTDDEKCSQFRITLTSRLRNADNAMATMPGASLEILSTAIDVDYNQIVEMCRGLTIPLIKAKECKIITYDNWNSPHVLTFTLGQMERVPIQSLGLIPLQAWGNVPAGETFVAPLESSANGEYLVNGAIGTEKVTDDREAIIQFEGGRMVRHFYVHNNEPVEHITQLKQTANSHRDSNCWNIIAEFGVGVNRKIKRIHGVQLIDEKKYGTVHVAIGHNAGYGGDTKCPSVHCDMTTVSPTVTLDGRKFIDRGEHVYDLDEWLDDYRTYTPAPGREWRVKDTYVKLNENSYRLTDDETLLVKHTTQSGRQTVYALGNQATSKCAYKLIRSFGVRTGRNVGELKSIAGMPTRDLLNLLSLLRANGIVYS